MNGVEVLGGIAADAADVLRDQPGSGVASWLLLIVFLWSGAAKLRQPELTSLAMVELGVLSRPRPGAGRWLALCELTLAGVLGAALALPAQFGPYALGVAAVALWSFAVVLTRALRSPEPVTCFCFGAGSPPVSRTTVLRTAALASIASLSATAGATEPPEATTVVVQQGVVALGVLGSLALAAHFRDLVMWNRNALLD